MCMDPFNDELRELYLEPVFAENNETLIERSAFWLDRNMPLINTATNIPASTNQSNPFYQLPFIPGNLPLANNTIPEYAYHNNSGVREAHFNLHGIFGHQMAK